MTDTAEVTKMKERGLTTAEIAKKLGLTVSGVAYHLRKNGKRGKDGHFRFPRVKKTAIELEPPELDKDSDSGSGVSLLSRLRTMKREMDEMRQDISGLHDQFDETASEMEKVISSISDAD